MIALKDFDIEDAVDLDVDTTVTVYSGDQTWLVHCKVDTDLEYCGSNDPDDNEQCRTYDCEISKVELLDEDGVVISNITDTVPAWLYSALALKIEEQAEQHDTYWDDQADYYASCQED